MSKHTDSNSHRLCRLFGNTAVSENKFNFRIFFMISYSKTSTSTQISLFSYYFIFKLLYFIFYIFEHAIYKCLISDINSKMIRFLNGFAFPFQGKSWAPSDTRVQRPTANLPIHLNISQRVEGDSDILLYFNSIRHF